MSVTTEQPEITADVLYQWRLMRDADAGNARIHSYDARITRSQTQFQRKNGDIDDGQSMLYNTYLPIPGGFIANWASGGQAMWVSYLKRAQFPEIIAPAVNAMTGIIHKSEWQIEMPDSMRYLWENATEDGATLEAFSRRITRELLLMGRYTLSVDSPEGSGDPYMIGHQAETLINWDKNFYVFNESGMVRDGFDWKEQIKYRIYELDESGNYVQMLVDANGDPLAEPIYPQGAAGPLKYVPIVVAGARDLTTNVEEPPLIGAADGALAVYRLDADYRHQLYMSGQETLVMDNAEAPAAIGPAVALEINSTSDNPAKAYYVSPTCAGIEAHRVAINEGWEYAARAGAKLFDSGSAVESGEARRMRQNAEAATLQTIANTGAAALEQALKYVADMQGANPDDVIVVPPRNLLDAPMTSKEVLDFVNAYKAGGISWKTMYENLQRGQIASNERDSDEELSIMNMDTVEVDSSAL